VVITLSSTTAPVLAAALEHDEPEEPEEPDESVLAISVRDEPLDGAAEEEPPPDALVPAAPEPPDEDDVSALPARAVVVESVALVPVALLEATWSSAARRWQPAAKIADSNRVKTRAFDVFD